MDSDILEGRCGSSLKSPLNMEGGLLDDNRDYDYIFTSPLDKFFECPVCCNVLRYPVQFEECGHRCCARCLSELVRVSSKCPVDQKPFNRETQVVVDKDLQHEIDQLEVKCSHVGKGCTWFGKLKDLELHMEDCRYVPLYCPQKCGMEIEKSFLKRHLQDECVKREVKCDFCEMPIKQEEEQSHYTVCGKFLLPCPNGCKKGEIPREELTDHLEKKCPKEEVPCPFHKAGCEYVCERKNMHKHIKDDPIQHLGMACDTIIEQEKLIDEHHILLEKHIEKISVLEKKVDTLEKLYGCQLVWKIEGWKEKFDQAKLGKKPTVFSPPFLTNRHGYHMAMSLCPYGDGRARGKFLSIFVCICRGEYDALLPWPFCHHISFTLIDQCQNPAARRNITYGIKPNTMKENKPFLGRPIGERNASFGAQRFVELDVVKSMDYVRDDCMFIKCTVASDQMIHL